MSRAQLTSTVEQNTGGAVSPYVAGKNVLINGGFDIWQRGTSNSNGNTYTADRWYTQSAGGATTSQQTSGAPIGSQYYLRSTSSAASGGSNYYQFIETVNTSQMWGRTVTFTVKLRRNATMNANLVVNLYASSTVDAGIAVHPATTLATSTVSNASLPTATGSSDWLTVVLTATVPNNGTANSVYVQVSLAANITTGASFDIAQAQLEIGAVATPFSRAGGTLSGELTLAQRYYFRNASTNASTAFGVGVMNGSAQARTFTQFPVAMRISPTGVDYANIQVFDGTSYYTPSAGGAVNNNPTGAYLYWTVSGSAASRAAVIQDSGSNNSYIAFSAEL